MIPVRFLTIYTGTCCRICIMSGIVVISRHGSRFHLTSPVNFSKRNTATEVIM